MKALMLAITLTLGSPWGAGQCASVEAPGYRWSTRQDDPDRAYLYQGQTQIGGYDNLLLYYRPYDAATGEWGDKCQPPTSPPARAGRPAERPLVERHIFGVDRSKLSGQESHKLHTERGCFHLTRAQAQQVLTHNITDDSQKCRITIIGNPEQCKVVAEDLGKVADIKEWAITRSYPPDHWAVKDGFVTTGDPTIYCQLPTGKVLHRQDDYEGGGDDLIKALRKAKPYDPKKDPDLRQTPSVFTTLNWIQIGSYLATLAVGIVGTIVLNRKG